METGECEICGCAAELQKHHLIPQHVSRSSKYGKKLKTDENNFLWICNECHSRIHAQFTDQQLRDFYFTKDALMGDPGFAKFVAWRRKHPDFRGSSKMSNGKKRR